MTAAMYVHPFSSYSWKALIPAWEKGFSFDYRSLEEPEHKAAFAALTPFARFPVLVEDGGRVTLEATTVIERLDALAPKPRMIPADPDAALEVRMLDRLSDNYLMTPLQTLVGDRMRAEGERDAKVAATAREVLRASYGWWEARMAGREWAAGSFSLADCATAPALFYADWVEPIPAGHAALRAYRARLLARPSVARAVDEARPFRHYFPFGAPARD